MLKYIKALCKNKKPVNVLFTGFSGERGIRTPGGVTLNSFQDCRNRPLCHFSSGIRA